MVSNPFRLVFERCRAIMTPLATELGRGARPGKRRNARDVAAEALGAGGAEHPERADGQAAARG